MSEPYRNRLAFRHSEELSVRLEPRRPLSSTRSISSPFPIGAIHGDPDPLRAELDRQQLTRWFSSEVLPHESALRAYLRGRFPHIRDAEDLIQETYARVVRAGKAGELKDVRPYLFMTARNAAIDLCRRSQIVSFTSLGDSNAQTVVEEKPDAAEIASRVQEVDLLHEAIRTLPERCRRILVLRRFHGLSHQAIASKLGISEKTVDAQLCIGIARCRAFLVSKGVLGNPPSSSDNNSP